MITIKVIGWPSSEYSVCHHCHSLIELHPISFQAMKLVSDERRKDASEKQQRERELSKIKVSKEDVDLIVSSPSLS